MYKTRYAFYNNKVCVSDVINYSPHSAIFTAFPAIIALAVYQVLGNNQILGLTIVAAIIATPVKTATP